MAWLAKIGTAVRVHSPALVFPDQPGTAILRGDPIHRTYRLE